jgi:tetratricopeptide (TPR) repeat protein
MAGSCGINVAPGLNAMNFLDQISVLAACLSVQTLFQLLRNWRSFWNAHVTLRDQSIAQRLAIFVLLPLTVPLHELGHCLATWQVGGTVAAFQWRFFWGYMIPVGDFSPAEYWWIALSGNLVSIILGLLAIFLILLVRQRILAELLYSFVCIDLINSLALYPLMSVTSNGGDWKSIYDFKVQPYAGLCLLVHIGLLWWLRRLYYSPAAVRWRLARNLSTLNSWEKLQATAIRANAQASANEDHQDLDTAIAKFNFLTRYGEDHAAQKIAKKLLATMPQNHRVQLLRVAIAHSKGNLQQTIKLGLPLLDVGLSPADQLILYRHLCVCYIRLNQRATALDYANRGLAIAPNDHLMHWHRAGLYLAQGQRPEAEMEIQIALANAPDEDRRQEIHQWVRQKMPKLNIS